MDTLFVLNKPIKNYKLKSKFINPRKKRVLHKPYTCVTFAPSTNIEQAPPCEDKISFVRLYNELCTAKRTPKSKFWLDVVQTPVQDSSGESIAAQYNSGGDLKMYKQNYPVALRNNSTATAEVMLEIDYGTL